MDTLISHNMCVHVHVCTVKHFVLYTLYIVRTLYM